jgi:hypothetical protein
MKMGRWRSARKEKRGMRGTRKDIRKGRMNDRNGGRDDGGKKERKEEGQKKKKNG